MVKKKIRGAGIKVGGDVTFGDVSGQVAIGENITQTQSLSFSNKKELKESLVQFQKEMIKLALPIDTMTAANEAVTAAIKETDKEKPDFSKVKNWFEGSLDRIKEVGDTIEKVSKWEWTGKIIKLLGKLGLSIVL